MLLSGAGMQRFHAVQIIPVVADAVARVDEGVGLLLGTLFSRKDYQRDRRGKHRRDQCGERNEPPGTVGFRAAAIRIVCQDANALRAGEVLQRLCKRAGQFRRECVGKANIYRALCAVMFYRAEQHLTAHRAAVDRAGGIGGNNVRLPVLPSAAPALCSCCTEDRQDRTLSAHSGARTAPAAIRHSILCRGHRTRWDRDRRFPRSEASPSRLHPAYSTAALRSSARRRA